MIGGIKHGQLIVAVAIAALSFAGYAALFASERALFLEGDLERAIADLGLHSIATVLLVILYAAVLVMSTRARIGGAAAVGALAFGVALHLLFWPARPYLSVDLFTYLAHGAQVVLLGSNPHLAQAGELTSAQFGRELMELGWRQNIPTSPYGPLWTWLETAVVWLTRDVGTGLLLMKAVAVGASLGSAAMVWAIAGALGADRLTPTVAYLWNPLIIGELAAEGHNDAVMILLVLVSLYAALRLRYFAAALFLGLSVLTKLLPLILAPALAAAAWGGIEGRVGRIRAALLGAVAAGIGGAILIAPFWGGSETFAGIGRAVETGGAFASTRWALQGLFGTGPGVDVLLAVVLTAAFAALALALSVRARAPRDLPATFAWIALAYVLVASPYFWPWHSALPIALMAISPFGLFRWMILAVTLGARLAAPLDVMFANGLITLPNAAALTYLSAIALPLVVLVLLAGRARVARAPLTS